MRKLTYALMFLFTAPVTAADVYRTVDEQGNIIFSDQPSAGAEKVELQETQIISPPAVEQFKYTPKREQPPVYDDVIIAAPAQDATIRDNAGNVSIKVQVLPKLGGSDQIHLYLDGKEIAVSRGGTFELQAVDRGTHSVRAVIKNNDGRIIASSKTSEFHLHRISSRARP